VQRPFRVRRIPLAWRLPRARLERPDNHDFHLAAVRYVRLTRPAVVYTRCHEVAVQCLRHGFRVIFETHDGPGNAKTSRYLPALAGARSLLGVVTTSELLKASFVESGLPADRVLARPNGIDLERFAGPAADRDAARRRLGLAPGRSLAVYVGSLYAHKGIGTLLEAAHLLPDVDFLLLGGTGSEAREWRARLPVGPNVSFRAFVPNSRVPAYLAAADVCVVPNSGSDRTAHWTFSLKLNEYMAARRPVVASDIPSLRCVVREGEEALFFAPDDAKALARSIRRLRDDPALAARLAANAWRRVRAHPWESRARDVLAAFAPALLEPRAGGR
jgi:glycosyltransferase involved in cell wall biosynthesis